MTADQLHALQAAVAYYNGDNFRAIRWPRGVAVEANDLRTARVGALMTKLNRSKEYAESVLDYFTLPPVDGGTQYFPYNRQFATNKNEKKLF